jgi:hypothetical protein
MGHSLPTFNLTDKTRKNINIDVTNTEDSISSRKRIPKHQ